MHLLPALHSIPYQKKLEENRHEAGFVDSQDPLHHLHLISTRTDELLHHGVQDSEV